MIAGYEIHQKYGSRIESSLRGNSCSQMCPQIAARGWEFNEYSVDPLDPVYELVVPCSYSSVSCTVLDERENTAFPARAARHIRAHGDGKSVHRK